MHRTVSPRLFIAAVAALILLTSLIGGLQAFSSVRAAPVSQSAALLGAASPTATPQTTCAPRSVTPSPSLTPTATPAVSAGEGAESADTAGIIAFAVLMVVIVIFGVLWASPKPASKRKPSPPKKERSAKRK